MRASRVSCYANALMTTATVVIIAVAVVLVPAMIIPLPVMALIPAITMMLLVTRNVLALVPVVLHKVDPLAAGIVFHNGPAIDDLRLRIPADVKPSIEAGLADADGNTDIGRECRNGGGGQ
ncbi:MAG: hypothetical protein H6R12_1282, partial [Proteobacteria bacterium]|nr:hypothetical protein [Pseudomonadota bacterium]